MDYIYNEITFKELHRIYKEDEYNIEVDSPEGWTNVVDIYEKENIEGYELIFDDNKNIKCAITHLLLTNNGWKSAEELNINDIILTDNINKPSKLVAKNNILSQKWLDIEVDNENSWYLCQDKINHNSGKSLIIYILCRYFLWKNKKIILLCPRIDLVNQMSDDFKDYFYSKEDRLIAENNVDELIKLRNNRKELNCEQIEEHVHKIFGGQEKYTNKNIIISTRDSLSIGQGRVNEVYFKNIDAVLVDEVHTCGAQTSSDIVKACNGNGNPNMYKLGFTGSLSDNIIDNLIIEGLIGETVEIIKMRQLMDLGLATNVLIQPLYLKYNNDYCKDIKKMNWAEENKFIRNLSERCEFIAKLANSFKDKNVMIIYQNKDSAEEILKNIIKLRNPDKEFKVKDYQQDNPEKVYLSWGETKASNRNDFRSYLEKSEGNILAGTTSVVSTGINIKNLHVFIFANVGKKDTLVIQSVGRLVRLHKSKDNAIIYDIVDDARYYTKSGKEYPNYHFKHWVERLDTYTNQEFDVLEPKAVTLNLKEKIKF